MCVSTVFVLTEPKKQSANNSVVWEAVAGWLSSPRPTRRTCRAAHAFQLALFTHTHSKLKEVFCRLPPASLHLLLLSHTHPQAPRGVQLPAPQAHQVPAGPG